MFKGKYASFHFKLRPLSHRTILCPSDPVRCKGTVPKQVQKFGGGGGYEKVNQKLEWYDIVPFRSRVNRKTGPV